jgi:hypothetical protein
MKNLAGGKINYFDMGGCQEISHRIDHGLGHYTTHGKVETTLSKSIYKEKL